MWSKLLGPLVVPYVTVWVCIVGYRWTDVGVMTEHNPQRQQLLALATLWHWGLQGRGGGFKAFRQYAQHTQYAVKHLTLTLQAGVWMKSAMMILTLNPEGIHKTLAQQAHRIIHTYSFSSLPSAQRHSYPLGRSMHLAPFWQGVLAHSSMSIWHMVPVNPGTGKHRG